MDGYKSLKKRYMAATVSKSELFDEIDRLRAENELQAKEIEILRADWKTLHAENEALKIRIKQIADDCYTNHSEEIATRLYAALRDQENDMNENTLQPYQQRVVEEKAELDKKACALSDFIGQSEIFPTLAFTEQALLKEQCEVMWQYSEILGRRIQTFGESNSP